MTRTPRTTPGKPLTTISPSLVLQAPNPNFMPVKIIPTRVELSEMFGSTNKRV